jgi:hypothetical protein
VTPNPRTVRHGALALVGAGVFAYLAWRLVTIVRTPSLAAVALWLVECLAWIGFAAFTVRVSAPRHPVPDDRTVQAPTPLVAILAVGASDDALERTLASVAAEGSAPRTVVVDADPSTARVAITTDVADDAVATACGALASVAADHAVILVRAGSLFTSGACAAIVAPMEDPRVAAVQAGLEWADPSSMVHLGPSRDALALFSDYEAPAASAAGISPLLGDGTAIRGDALHEVAASGSLEAAANAFAASARLTRFVPEPLVLRPHPASASAWRTGRAQRLAADCRSSLTALHQPVGSFRIRVRRLAAAGDVASAWARVGLAALLTWTLVSGTVPVPGSPAPVVVASGVLWLLATLLTRAAVGTTLRLGDRNRLGWRCLDADIAAGLIALRPTSARARDARRSGRIRRLAGFPVTLLALVAVDTGAVLRGLTLAWPHLVPGLDDGTLGRVATGVAVVVVTALLADSMRMFVARPDARVEIRMPVGVRGRFGTASVEVVDISPTGAGLLVDVAPAIGDRLVLACSLPFGNGAEPLALRAEVMRVASASDGRTRVGVRFVTVERAERALLIRYAVRADSPRPTRAATAVASTNGLPQISAVNMPRPLLRFISVFAVVAACSSLVVAPAFAAPSSVGTIHGTVKDSTGAVSGLCVSVVDGNWSWTGTQSDANGEWTLDVASGPYKIQYQDCRGVTPRLADAWWSQIGPVTQNQAGTVQVDANTSTASIDVQLQPGVAFSGSVQDQQGNPVDGACINPVDAANNWVSGVQTPTNNLASGQFATDPVLPGNYRIRVAPCNSSQGQQFAQGWLDNGGNLVPDQQNASTFSIGGGDYALPTITVAPGTRLVGTVTDVYHAPLSNICVNVDSTGNNSNWIAGTQTQPDGTYVVPPVAPGNYYLNFNDCRPNPSAVGTNYDGTADGTLDRNQAQTIHVDGTQEQLGPFDQTLQPGGRISGTVSTNTGPVANVCVNAIKLETVNGQVNGDWIAGTQTASDGTYTVGPVPDTDVMLEIDSCGNAQIVSGFYNGNGNLAIPDPTHAATVHPQPGQTVSGTDIRADAAALLSGHITTAGGPAANVCVSAVDPATGATGGAQTGNDGAWSTTLPSGSYEVQAVDCQHGRSLAGHFIPSGTDPATAPRVVAASGAQVEGLDADLAAGATSTIHGRITTQSGPVPNACAIALVPNRDPVGYGQTDADGNFDIGPLPAGAYIVGILDCGFLANQNSQPSGVHDPTDPSIVYPVQWSDGRAVSFTNTWQDPAWTVVASGAATDLGDICLGCTPSTPAVQPPATIAPGTPDPFVATTTAPPLPTAPATAPPAVTPRTSPPRTSPPRGATATKRSTATTAASAVVATAGSAQQTLDASLAAAPEQRIHTKEAVATTAAPSSWTDWWWLLALAGIAGALATAVPYWLRNRSSSSPEWPV